MNSDLARTFFLSQLVYDDYDEFSDFIDYDDNCYTCGVDHTVDGSKCRAWEVIDAENEDDEDDDVILSFNFDTKKSSKQKFRAKRAFKRKLSAKRISKMR